MMEGLKLIPGEILIPMDPRQKIGLPELLKPSCSMFRSVLHQGELALVYFFVQVRLEPVPLARAPSGSSASASIIGSMGKSASMVWM